MKRDIHILALVKGEERYIFLYDESQRVETLRMLGRYAANPELSFSWHDAATLSKRIREISVDDQTERNLSTRTPHKASPRFSFRES
ncbi:MAG: hypothetical protein KDB03_17465 [Planctomycetales bacterium]|nr:hypothetical protein [Planctomycetales bacterium]